MRALACCALVAVVAAHSTLPPGYPTDCRNITWDLHGDHGPLRVLSWHVHYNTNTSEFKRFYDTFIAHYKSKFDPKEVKCPFGYSAGEADHPYICSLEGVPSSEDIDVAATGDPVFSTPSRAFFVPFALGEEAFAWASSPEVKGSLDILIHPNSGCMYDDHGPRATWSTYNERQAPTIQRLAFACNIPGYGCSELDAPCNCLQNLLPSDAPEDSCKGCHPDFVPPNTILM